MHGGATAVGTDTGVFAQWSLEYAATWIRPVFQDTIFGIYGQLLSYDFRVGKYGYMGGKSRGAIFDNPSYVAALEYGYTLPVGRRINIDFSIGIGYMGRTLL